MLCIFKIKGRAEYYFPMFQNNIQGLGDAMLAMLVDGANKQIFSGRWWWLSAMDGAINTQIKICISRNEGCCRKLQ